MFCIAAFIVLAILSIFSARYRKLAADAWKCVARRATLRKCDTNFKEDMKGRLLGKIVLKRPRLARFLDKWLDALSFVFVALMVWSIVVVIHSGLNLYVYNTCNPANSESCSLGAQACSIESVSPSFWQSVKHGHIASWTTKQVKDFGTTISRVPDRARQWQPSQYTNAHSSYYRHYDASKPVGLEIVDPGCRFCAQLFRNIKEAGVENRYNLTYIPYPIADPAKPGVYKFPHSQLVASYLESIRLHPLNNGQTPADWQVLERLFTWQDKTGVTYQAEVNTLDTAGQTEALLQQWLGEIGYTPAQMQAIVADTHSNAVQQRLASNRQIVEKQIKTVKIPTLLLNHRRYDGVVPASQLH